ncbi:MAG: acyltransferase [Saprospiraceae bacterium]|jgi:acetyltransferase-like isoleucine patch superfamily enzyme|nr:acyltransferase [Saprospiraceae bacterium]
MYENNYNPLAWIRGVEKGQVHIGDKCWIGPFCVIDGEYDHITLGEGVNVSSGAQILTHDTVKRCISKGHYTEIDHAPTFVGHFVFIGTNAVILKGCTIGDHCIIAAGAVLTAHSVIPPYSLVAGVPARVKADIRHHVEALIHGSDTI